MSNEEVEIDAELLEFARAMQAKRDLRRSQYPDRPRDPWNHYPAEVLRARLSEEYREFRDAIFDEDEQGEAGECVDVANFGFFRWKQIQLKREKEAKNGKA